MIRLTGKKLRVKRIFIILYSLLRIRDSRSRLDSHQSFTYGFVIKNIGISSVGVLQQSLMAKCVVANTDMMLAICAISDEKSGR